MAMTYTARTNTFTADMIARTALLFTNIPMAISDYRANQKTARSLRSLSAYQLDDIGLMRGDIDKMLK